ncbi:hypothetical protein NKG94_43260 [Micromonospora sp. M12]
MTALLAPLRSGRPATDGARGGAGLVRRVGLRRGSAGGLGLVDGASARCSSPRPGRAAPGGGRLLPAVAPDDAVFAGVDRLRGIPLGLWCGRQDDLLDDVQALERALPEPPARAEYAEGRHDFRYWGRVIPGALDFVAAALAASPRSPG